MAKVVIENFSVNACFTQFSALSYFWEPAGMTMVSSQGPTSYLLAKNEPLMQRNDLIGAV